MPPLNDAAKEELGHGAGAPVKERAPVRRPPPAVRLR